MRLLQEAPAEALERAAADTALLERAAAVEAAVEADLARPPADVPATPDRPAAFFCAEYGVHRSLPIYSGGLGALAGDILKEASDRALPLVAVGLLYRQGYFRQRIDAGGWQHEYWVDTDPERSPAALVTGPDGEPVTVTVPVRDLEVTAQLWRVDVGRIPLLLLDTERPENDVAARWITSRLYIGDPELRLAQYILLGVGGVRALQALDIEPGLLHLNEGHAAFVSLELARIAGGGFAEGVESARSRTIFTTHTPVPAGNDTYPVDQVCGALDGLLDHDGRRRRRDRAARPHQPGRRARAVRRHPVRPAHLARGQRREPAPRRDRPPHVARPVARPVARRRADRARHERRPRAHVGRRPDAAAARPPPRRRLARPRRRPRDVGARGRHPGRGAVGGAPGAARRVRRVRAREERRRPARPRRAALLRRGRRRAPSTPRR